MSIPCRTLAVLLACTMAATAGCANTDGASRYGSAQNTRSTASPVSDFFAGFGTPSMARGRSGMYGETYEPYPPLDPGRRISEQDCGKPIVHDGGNLRCK